MLLHLCPRLLVYYNLFPTFFCPGYSAVGSCISSHCLDCFPDGLTQQPQPSHLGLRGWHYHLWSCCHLQRMVQKSYWWCSHRGLVIPRPCPHQEIPSRSCQASWWSSPSWPFQTGKTSWAVQESSDRSQYDWVQGAEDVLCCPALTSMERWHPFFWGYLLCTQTFWQCQSVLHTGFCHGKEMFPTVSLSPHPAAHR